MQRVVVFAAMLAAASTFAAPSTDQEKHACEDLAQFLATLGHPNLRGPRVITMADGKKILCSEGGESI